MSRSSSLCVHLAALLEVFLQVHDVDVVQAHQDLDLLEDVLPAAQKFRVQSVDRDLGIWALQTFCYWTARRGQPYSHV